MFRRCVECELVVMPRPFMVCDDCAKRNDRAINRMAAVEQSNRQANIQVSRGTYKVVADKGSNK